MHELEREAAMKLQLLVDIYLDRGDLDEAARVLVIIEELDRRINKNVVQMSGWESSVQQTQRDTQSQSG